MKRFAKLLLVTLGFGAVGFAMSLVPQKTATGAGSAPVTVMNTPLPVTGAVAATQNGSWNVGINGTPSVNAVQSGAWNVGISGTPSVTIANSSLAVTTPAGTTNLGQDVNSLFEFVNTSLGGALCTWFQVPFNGSALSTCASIPSGDLLIVTDVEWSITGGSTGTDYFLLLDENGHYHSEIETANSNGDASKNDHLTAGLVFDHIPVPFIATTPVTSPPTSSVTIRGYFVSKQ